MDGLDTRSAPGPSAELTPARSPGRRVDRWAGYCASGSPPYLFSATPLPRSWGIATGRELAWPPSADRCDDLGLVGALPAERQRLARCPPGLRPPMHVPHLIPAH